MPINVAFSDMAVPLSEFVNGERRIALVRVGRPTAASPPLVAYQTALALESVAARRGDDQPATEWLKGKAGKSMTLMLWRAREAISKAKMRRGRARMRSTPSD